MTVVGTITLLSVLLILAAGAVVSARLWRAVRDRGFDRWVPAHLFPNDPVPHVILDREPVDVFLAICDHYEPEWGNPTRDDALARVHRWCEEYPRRFGEFHDVDGRHPRHSFFFPQDQYRPEYIDPLADLCRDGFGEFEIGRAHV